ncbi:hypothetical protein HIM_05231 [Hirsutella minnesotensis 3608]|uniref:DUF7053 domain-containing protein n=1 Tax=Hirsutella minnesotensis 3608 TaxID=1043627 RepID=A0A0F7ZPD4_9HYPO|nr:hypothetical protein HIM_05231 [Hirsutella minnesotensis 3608]
MLRKKEAYTVVTPIPGFIPRQLALDILHAHSEVITLNPLILSHRPVPAPRNAAADEYYSTWYEMTERIQYVPGVGRAGSGKITFSGCFHDLPWGLQTHVYAPLGIDLRHRYRVAGNQPGLEPPEEHRELGLEALGAPHDGLYLREDIEIRCNIALVSFVKSQLRAASRDMIRRFIKKAELLDAGVLQAMMDNGKLKTFNPNDRSARLPQMPSPGAAATTYPPTSPDPYGASPTSTPSPVPYSPYETWKSYEHAKAAGGHRRVSLQAPPPVVAHVPVELPGDTAQPLPPSPALSQQHARPVSALAPSFRYDSTSPERRFSHGQLSPPLSDANGNRFSDVSALSGSGGPSPSYARQSFATELPVPEESTEATRQRRTTS